MRDVADRLLSRNPRRLVLFDSPPLLVSSEARALAQIPGQIVLVARAGRTPQRAVTDAIAQIDKAKLQGLVLNDAYVGVEQAYYDYYGYGEPVDTVAKQPAR
jgi:protein-tyrosine kinase